MGLKVQVGLTAGTNTYAGVSIVGIIHIKKGFDECTTRSLKADYCKCFILLPQTWWANETRSRIPLSLS